MRFEVARQTFQGIERFSTDVVFHAFNVAKDNGFGQIKKPQKLSEQFVAVGDARGHGYTGVGEDHAAILFVFYQALGVETLHHGGDAGLGNFKFRGDIDYPGVTLGANECGDALEVILGGGGGARCDGKGCFGFAHGLRGNGGRAKKGRDR